MNKEEIELEKIRILLYKELHNPKITGDDIMDREYVKNIYEIEDKIKKIKKIDSNNGNNGNNNGNNGNNNGNNA